MIRSAACRFIQHSTGSRRHLFVTPFLRFPTDASSVPPSPQNPFIHEQQPNQETPISGGGEDHGAARDNWGNRAKVRSSYEDEQARVLRAALSHVPRVGWSDSAMIYGARDVCVSPSIVGSFPRREAALVEFFMDDCLQKLIDRIDSGVDLNDLILSDRLVKLIRIRLEMQVPYISKWPQALSIQAQPMNLPTSLKQRAALMDEIWHAAGDHGSDIDWYVKRTVLGGIYSTSEVYMMTDDSPEFRNTWNFLEHRVKDAFELQKSVLEVAYLAEAIGASVGSSMKGFVKRVFQA
ncbi:ubiquinone biosynthesis protein COQ9, mitochondrial [Phalaenopsis equestris]|uniref:ubiquinone biosynthesis protein COQ9, mitochondrial n=1 Tax=Phalaenopsis equestris TaxID=78828 RepID=UPI0009E51962|nr:ubiquinone biosynthesis protein COQ9, mitochondrial [Phalaenopsis equestris]